MDLIQSILNKWIEVTKYDRNQTKFNLLSSNYQFHRCGERIEELLNYDSSGVFACLYAKSSFETICKGISCKLIDLLKDPNGIDEYVEMWNIFNCEEMKEIENSAIQNIIRITSIHPMIGESDKEQELDLFRDSVEYIAEELTKCRTECYSMIPNTCIDKDIRFMTTLQVFNTTTECMLNIEQSPDGMYLCYITDFNSCGGYFAYVIKSGHNILSINDRIDENFIGQHTRSRNNRFIENKKWHIFPYDDIISCDGDRDYLGYTKSLVCEVKPREIKELSSHSIYPIMLAAVLLMKRYCGNKIDDIVDGEEVCQVYIDSLLKQNIVSEEVTSIIPISSANSLICTTNENIPIFNFTSNNVKSNELNSKYNWSKENKIKYSGVYTDVNKILIDTYGEGFELKPLEVMRRQWPQLTDGTNGSSDTVISEYIGPKDKIELEYYRQCRLQLRNHILKGMQKAYQEAGGADGIHEWYKQSLIHNTEALRQRAVDWYIDYLDGNVQSYSIDGFSITTSDELQVSLRIGEQGHWAPRLNHDYVINECKPTSKHYWDNRYDLYNCPITGNVANMWFIFVPNTWQNIEKLVGQNVPKILKGFKYSGSDYSGNHLLDSCDPIALIKNPFESRNNGLNYDELFPGYTSINFMAAVGFSKRGLNQLVKQRREVNR